MQTAEQNTLTPAQQKAATEAAYRARRKARKFELVELHKAAVAAENAKKPKTPFVIAFRSRRLRRDGVIETLPQEFARILKACEELITNKKRFPALYAWGGDGVNNIQCRTNIARVLACILVNTDLIGGRIGEPTEAGIQTISWDQVQEDYALRFGEFIAPKSFAKALKYLRRAGYLHCERINVNVNEKEGTVRSAPAYKQLTERFFADLKVVRYPNIVELILATRKRQESKGLHFKWLSFRNIAKQVQEIYNGKKLDGYAEATASVFQAFSPSPAFTPH
ncbi:hypothetical protein ACV970_004609 [Vibrio parahaemolyticus]|uniref:hypothetical protein n=1 Tax=Vibrio parahaemolyticus TaxID=670 RepID=UPI0007A0DB34|nr:hypothetical protein [Vibrio parahaemolyticus]EGQ8399462.1 hypothetical protein [Vibrio parahaemolyticus]EGQ9147791.1 hypothetical protein [Vibrio parahaemolyticus]EGR0987917.1 hypothetical protein [Vibrio parahaemolyticus]EGR1374238.1 hypothetical protein [Vibrio parahaemolyticus]EHY8973434.1 hypothetical protein [Vibrio parahaemolyticus]